MRSETTCEILVINLLVLGGFFGRQNVGVHGFLMTSKAAI